MESQNKKILKHLQQGFSITPLEALRMFGSFRLGARIHNLKEEGYNIQTTLVLRDKKRVASYKLIK